MSLDISGRAEGVPGLQPAGISNGRRCCWNWWSPTSFVD